MLITCDNKGCFKSSNALLNESEDAVICGECGGTINGLSEYMRRTLKSSGQIVRSDRKAFAIACMSCKANREVVLDQDNNTICKICHTEITIPIPFKIAMEEAGGLKKIEVPRKDGEPVKKTAKKVIKKKAAK